MEKKNPDKRVAKRRGGRWSTLDYSVALKCFLEDICIFQKPFENTKMPVNLHLSGNRAYSTYFKS